MSIRCQRAPPTAVLIKHKHRQSRQGPVLHRMQAQIGHKEVLTGQGDCCVTHTRGWRACFEVQLADGQAKQLVALICAIGAPNWPVHEGGNLLLARN